MVSRAENVHRKGRFEDVEGTYGSRGGGPRSLRVSLGLKANCVGGVCELSRDRGGEGALVSPSPPSLSPFFPLNRALHHAITTHPSSRRPAAPPAPRPGKTRAGAPSCGLGTRRRTSLSLFGSFFLNAAGFSCSAEGLRLFFRILGRTQETRPQWSSGVCAERQLGERERERGARLLGDGEYEVSSTREGGVARRQSGRSFAVFLLLPLLGASPLSAPKHKYTQGPPSQHDRHKQTNPTAEKKRKSFRDHQPTIGKRREGTPTPPPLP